MGKLDEECSDGIFESTSVSGARFQLKLGKVSVSVNYFFPFCGVYLRLKIRKLYY